MPVLPTPAPTPAPTPTVTPSPAADDAQSLRSALLETRSQLAALESSQVNSAAESALATAVAGSGIHWASPAAAQQAAQLMRDQVHVAKGSSPGQYVPMGPAGEPLADYVRARLASPEFAHFQRGAGSAAPAPASSSTPLQPLPADDWRAGEQARAAGTMTLSEAALRAVPRTPTGVDPARDIALPFALKPRSIR